MYLFKRSVIVLIFVHNILSKEIPAFIKNARCHLKHEDYDECFKNNGNKIIPLIAKGVPELGIPNLMPLKLPFVQLIDEPNLHLNITNIKVYGLENLRIINARTQIETGEIKAQVKGSNITITGDYSADGQISALSVKGHGPFSIYFENGSYNQTIVISLVERKGETYFKRKSIHMEYHLERVVFNFENLFEGNKHLGNTVNDFLNENWESILNEFEPGILAILENLMGKLLFDKFEDIPLREIFYLD